MLKLAEGGIQKCHKYFPEISTDEDPSFQGGLGGIKVVKIGGEKITKHLMKRVFEVTDLTTG